MRSVSAAISGLGRRRGRLLLSGWLLLWGLCAVSLAQITLDGSLGPRGALSGPHYRIPAEVGQIRGSNLFHSFGEFNVPTQGSATFTGPQTITNILSRVTGGKVSLIDGTLRSEIAGANLYLLNPSGVMFGPNASLDVSGSFHVSTADYLRLADGARFFARLSETSTLSVSPPVAFGFLGPMPAAITVQGSPLEVSEGQTLSVIGGDVQIVGGILIAPSGRINIASVASPGEVSLTASGIDVGSFAQLGDIHLSQGGLLDVRGTGGGTVVIRGGQLTMESAAIVAGTSGDIDGGGIDIAAGSVTLTGGAQIVSLSAPPGQGTAGAIVIRADRVTVQGEDSIIGSDTSGAGASGLVMVEAGRVTVRQGGAILSSTEGAGPAGSITIKAGVLEMDGGDIQARAEEGSTGSAGAITVTAGHVTLTGLAQIDSSTFGAGPGGIVTVRAMDTLTIAGHDGLVSSGLLSNTSGEGTAGTITVEAGRITLQDEGVISSSTFGAGPGGRIIVKAGTLEMEGGGLIQAQSAASSTGSAGAVAVTAGRITLAGGAQISSGTRSVGSGGTVTVTVTEALTITGRPSGLFSSTEGQGAAGPVTVEAGQVVLQQEGRIASTTSGTGPGGSVTIKAGSLVMEGGLIQTTSANGESAAAGEKGGDAGAIAVAARGVTLTAGAQIDSSTRGAGHGGTVAVTDADAVAISGDGSGFFTNTSGVGHAGDIVVQARQLQLREGATISAKSSGSGNAGSVAITTSESFQSANSAVTTTATEGAGGVITVKAGTSIDLTAADITATVTGGRQPGGSITLTTPVLTLMGGHLAVETQGAGNAGNLTLNVGSLTAQGATLTSSSIGMATGDAGTVRIQGLGGPGSLATRVTLTKSSLATDATVADGGDIQVLAQGTMRLQDSQITTTVRSGVGRGGNILIDPDFVILERSQIRADAFGGPGGNIRIVARGFFTDVDSRVSASSAQSVAGIVDIQAFTNPSGLVAPRPLDFASVAALLRDQCAARLHEGLVSSLVERERDGIPVNPDGLLPSRLVPMSPNAPLPSDADHLASLMGVLEHTGLRVAPSAQLSVQEMQVRGRSPGMWRFDCVSR